MDNPAFDHAEDDDAVADAGADEGADAGADEGAGASESDGGGNEDAGANTSGDGDGDGDGDPSGDGGDGDGDPSGDGDGDPPGDGDGDGDGVVEYACGLYDAEGTACDMCLAENCCDQGLTCLEDDGCTCLALCVLGGDNLGACMQTCGEDAALSPGYGELMSCRSSKCSMSC